MQEKNYDFQKRHWNVHKAGRRNYARVIHESEVALNHHWKLGCAGSPIAAKAIRDFQDYLWVSMELALPMTAQQEEYTLWLKIDSSIEKGFLVEARENGIEIKLAKDEEAFRAVVWMEDVMNLEGAPVLPLGQTVRRPLYGYRAVHSGCGLDQYPDAELLATVHAGYDAIILSVTDFDYAAVGYCNINDVIHRAAAYGIGVIFYNYIPSFFHPDEPNVQEKFDAVYGELFRRYPDALGIMLFGESLEFPSKDPHTTGKHYYESMQDGIPDIRPSPGWYPCEDYPAYLACIEQAIHKVQPAAHVIFSSYNWGYERQELRERFLKQMPKGIELSVPYELFAQRTLEGLKTPVMDYTLSAEEPSEYFVTECQAASKQGIAIQGNVNTTGIAWDFGCVPYVPAPYKLLHRLRRLRRAHAEWGVTTHYATHHYGWWNCVASDLGKWSSWENFEPDYDSLLEKIAVRDYGKDADKVLAAWKCWSEAMDYYVASNEDQYGPWRVGAAYPFIFQPNITRTLSAKEIQFPTASYAYVGYKIIKTLYQPFENIYQAPGFLRFPAELRRLEQMLSLWKKGIAEVDAMEETEESQLLKALGVYICCAIQTTMHIKQWWLKNMALQTAPTAEAGLKILDEITAIASAEKENVQRAFPAVETDSRLGWEPSEEYVCDPWHLNWKLRQLESAMGEVADYRRILMDAYMSS